MDPGASSSSRGRVRNRRIWDRKEEDILIEALKEIVIEGWKVDNAFKSGFLQVLEVKLMSALPGTDLRGTPHIESKIKTWKKHYNSLGDMLNTSGFGWNDTTKTIEVDSDDVWQAYIKHDPSAAFMRNKPFIFFDAWTIIFSKDRATGEFAESAADAVAAMRSEQHNADHVDLSPQHVTAGIEEMDFSATQGEQGSVQSEGRSKRKKGKDGIVEVLSDFVDNFRNYCVDTKTNLEFIGQRVGHAQDVSAKRARVNEELHKLPLTSEERLDVTLAISNNAQNVEVFFSLSEEDKLTWVRRLSRTG